MNAPLTLTEVALWAGVSPDEVMEQVSKGDFPQPEQTRTDVPTWSRVAVANSLMHEVSFKRPRANRVFLIEQLHAEVLRFYDKHGHAAIPSDAEGRRLPSGGRFKLGQGVVDLRAAYRQGRLSEADASSFQSLPDWSWDGKEANWLAQWHEASTAKPTPAGRRWLSTQWNNLDSLAPHRRERLLSRPDLAPGEAVPPSRVPEFVAAMRVWLAEQEQEWKERRKIDPDLPGPPDSSDVQSRAVVEVDGEPVPVGRQAVYYRRRMRGLEGSAANRLPEEDVELIESLPGWTWEAPRTGTNVTMAVRAAEQIAAAVRKWLELNPDRSVDDMAFTQMAVVQVGNTRRKVHLGQRVRAYQNRAQKGAAMPDEVRAVFDAVEGWTWTPPEQTGQASITEAPTVVIPSRRRR